MSRVGRLWAASFGVALFLGGSARGDALYNAQITVLDPPPFSLCAGAQRTMKVKLVNAGSVTWTVPTFHLAYHWVQGANVVVPDGVRTYLPAPVGAGGSVTLDATVMAPPAAGTYTLRFDMVEEGVTWFQWKGSSTTDVANVEIRSKAACLSEVALAPALLSIPHIDGCFSSTKTGGFVVCWGQNFGAQPGTILMKGLPSPNGEVNLTAAPQTLKWDNQSFFVTVPDSLSGFRKQLVTIQVRNRDGRASNSYTIAIGPALDVVSVSTGVNLSCPGKGFTDCEKGFNAETGWWNMGTHDNLVLFGSGDGGTDDWSFSLKNDWVTDHFDWVNWENSQVRGFEAGKAFLKISVDWHYDWGFSGGGAGYGFNVWAIGPRGVPYN